METPLPHPHGFGPLVFQWWFFTSTWHFMKRLSRAASVALATAGHTVRTLPTCILENADTKVLITLCCAFHNFCPAQREQMH